MSTATLPPWLSPWSTGLVYGQRIFKASEHIRPLDRSRHRPRLTIYTYGHGNNAPILRFSSWSEDGSGAGVGPELGEGAEDGVGMESSGGMENKGRGSAAPPAVRWERVPLDREPWHVDVPVPIQPRVLDRPHPYDVTIHSDVDYEPPSPGSEALHAWSGVLRGWAAGATLLALLVVIVRVGERFLDWKILMRRRRLHREWQRANVRATSRLENLHPLSELSDECSTELPPPYSACAAPKDDRCEEPPPPYSDCVQLVNKNGPVIMYSREAQRRVDRILREMNGTDSTSISPERPGFEENADEHARLTFEIDRILRVCVNRNEAPPTATERLSIYEQLCRRWPPRDNVSPSTLRRDVESLSDRRSANEAVPVVEAMNTANANVEASPLPTEEASSLNNPADDIDPIDADGDGAPNTNPTNDMALDVASAYTGADPLGVNDVPKDGSVVV